VLVIVAMLMVVFLGLAALAIDTGVFDQAQSQAQSAADSGAIAAAQDLVQSVRPGSATTDGAKYAASNDPGAGSTVTTSSSGSTQVAQVGVSKTVPATVGHVLGVNQATVGATAVASVNNASIVSDGSFNSPYTTSQCNPFCIINNGETIGPWTAGSNGVDLVTCGDAISYGMAGSQDYITAPPGDPSNAQVIDLNNDANGEIFETVATVLGDSYTVSFNLSGNPTEGPQLLTGAAFWHANSISTQQTFSYQLPSPNGKSNTWVPQTMSFVATSTSTVIGFFSTANGGGNLSKAGPVIADVSMWDTSVHLIK
jgi:Flp pilus assembly protein TadG